MQQFRIRHTLQDHVGDPRDWLLTWELRDNSGLCSKCDFCGQGDLRVTYEVRHAVDARRLWVCQRCVGRYPIQATRDDVPLAPQQARAQVHELTVRLMQRTCKDVIRQVQATAADPAIEEVVVYYDRNLQLSPTRAATLFNALPQATDTVDIRIFEVQMRSSAHQHEFGAMDDRDKLVVWPALSPQQRRRLIALGFAPIRHQSRRAVTRDNPRGLVPG